MLDDDGIKSIFSSLKDTIEKKNVEKILSFYNQEENIFQEKIEASYLEWIENKGAKYSHKILDISKTDDEIVVILSRVIEYQKDDLVHHNPQWSKIYLRKINSDWKIIKEAVYKIAKNIKTDLEIDLNVEENKIMGYALLAFDLEISNLDVLHLKLNRGLKPTEIFDTNNKPINFRSIGDSIELKTKDILVDGNSVAVKIRYNGIPYNSTEKWGYKIIYIGKEGTYASFISNWYPQIAYSKSTGKVVFNVPKEFIVTCTGKEVGKELIKDKAIFTFEISVLHIYAFAAAKFFTYSEIIDGKKFGAYFLKGGENKAKLYLQKAIEIISFLKNEVFGVYPYENYSIVEIPSEFVGRTGGMSEQGMNFYPDNSLNEYYVNTPIFAHEIGHLYWGNWVIGGLIFASEGLANTGYALTMEKLYGEEIMRKLLKYGAIEYFQAAYYYFATIAEKEEQDMKIGINRWGKGMKLHALSNTKGFFVLMMLRDTIGKKAFYKGLQTAIKKYAHTYMTLDELRGEFEKAYGKDLKWFFDQWFFRIGAPEYELEYITKKNKKNQFETSGSIKQKREIYQTKIEIELANNEHKITKKLHVDDKTTEFSLITDFEPKSVELDPNYKVFRWTQEFKKLPLFGDAMIEHWFNHDKSKEQFREYLEKEPDCILGHCWSGIFNYRDFKDKKQGIHDLNYVIENADPTGPYEIYYCNALYYLGLIYQEDGNANKAQDMFEKLLANDRTKRYHLIAKKNLEKLKEK